MTDQPTPNTMPGAEPADTAQPESKPTSPKGEVTPEKTGISAEDLAELNRLRNIHKDESKWEKRAKQNFDDAQRWRELSETLGGKEAKEFDPRAAFDELRKEVEKERTERTRADVARTTGVDPDFIAGTTVEEMQASAQRYLDSVNARIEEALKAKNAPAAPPASTVTSNGKIVGPNQITSREELAKLSPDERVKAYEEGRLDSMMGKTPS
jgi:hypothetical protein